MNKKFSGKTFTPPKKHFIFGDLRLETKNAGSGARVRWNHHVAPTVKISGKSSHPPDTLYILDPSASPTPLTKAEFHQKFVVSGTVGVTGSVTCQANTYNKVDKCFFPSDMELDGKIHPLKDTMFHITKIHDRLLERQVFFYNSWLITKYFCLYIF